MELKYHGIEYNDTKNTGWFHLGILQLLFLLVDTFLRPKSTNEEKRPEWANKWFDIKFDQAVWKFKDTFQKFDRSARHLGRCIEVVNNNQGIDKLQNYPEFLTALGDVPLYLDLLLFYLKIQADCLANVIPNFYGQRGKAIKGKARERFGKQRNWFINNPTFDSDYTIILNAEFTWFKRLAGVETGQGLRDIITHLRGIYQLTFAEYINWAES